MLAFIAPDQNTMSALREEVKRFLAWKSIKEDSIDLNLDAAQNRETENNLNRSNQTVESRIMETLLPSACSLILTEQSTLEYHHLG